MESVISLSITLIKLPFKVFSIIIINPITRFLQVLNYGLIVVPIHLISSIVNFFLLPFYYFKPKLNIDYSIYNILKDLEIFYQFIICSILFGVCIGVGIGLIFCVINYLLSFQNTSFKLFDMPSSPLTYILDSVRNRRNALYSHERTSDKQEVQETRSQNPILKRENSYIFDQNLHRDSIYEDDDGYGLNLDSSEVSTTETPVKDEITDDSSRATILTSNHNNLTSSTSLTSYTEDQEQQDLRYRHRMRKSNNDEYETGLMTDDTEEDGDNEDVFFDTRLITVIPEE